MHRIFKYALEFFIYHSVKHVELAEIDTEGDGRITYDEMRGWLARHDGERSQAGPEPGRRRHF